MSKIIIKLTSRERPEKFFKALDNIISLATGDYLILCTLDHDDPAMYDNETTRKRMEEYMGSTRIKIVWGQSKSKVNAINRDMCEVEHLDWKILINTSDDVEFTVQGFDSRILNDMEKHFPDTDGCLHYHDGTIHGAKFMTVNICGRKYFERSKRIYHPEYLSVYCDEEETRRAKDLWRLVYFKEGLFIHKHWLFNPSTKDKLNEKNDSLEMYEHDRQIFLRRNPTLFINYATRGRPEHFFSTLYNIESTISTPYYTIMVKADNDDPTMNNDDVRTKLKAFKNITLIYGNHKSKVDAINSHLQFAPDFSWMINMSDDMRFVTPGWDKLMLEDIQREWGHSLDFFAHFNDGHVGHKLPTLNVIGRDYFKRTNVVYDRSYGSVSCDAENMFVAMMLGKHKYFDKIYFTHDHPANLNTGSDETYRRNDRWGNSDTENYFTRRARLFDVQHPVFIPYNKNERR